MRGPLNRKVARSYTTIYANSKIMFIMHIGYKLIGSKFLCIYNLSSDAFG